jgi:hypothetical protein
MRIIDLVNKRGLDAGETEKLFPDWLFQPAARGVFLLKGVAQESIGSIWRVAHGYEKWVSRVLRCVWSRV